MTREMTPKDALEFIIDTFNKLAQKPQDIGLMFKFCEAHEKINQALDRLELLEQENQGLKNKNAALKIKVKAWEIQGEKYQKVIDILKSKKVDLVILLSSNDFKEYNANITIRINGVTYLKGNNYTLTQQEYELLKEVLENV